MDEQSLKTLWENPAHWTMWSYRCAADPRIIVPKRPPGVGLTLNAGHRWAWPVLILLIILAFGPSAFIIGMEGFPFAQLHFFTAIGVSVVALALFCLIFGRKA